jgi:isopentenyl-diphosphate delta-isomerase type 1
MSEEYLDVVDEDNQITGQEPRRIVHQTGLWHRGVHVFLFTPTRKLLVQQRSQTQDTFPGALDCSVSEHLRVGESYQAGAARGLREELGLEPPRLTRLLRLKMNYGPGDNMINELYQGLCTPGVLAVDQREIARTAWYALDELDEMLAQGQVPFAYWFRQLLLWYSGKPSAVQVLWEKNRGSPLRTKQKRLR